MSDRITSSYKASKDIYDDVLTQSSMLGRLYIKLFWHGVDDNGMSCCFFVFTASVRYAAREYESYIIR